MLTAVLVIGLGRAERGDDGVGPAIARRVRELDLDAARVIDAEEPAGMLDAWDDAAVVVVADAVRSGRRAGTVQIVHAGDGPLPVATGAGGTHDLGLAEVVELARALGRLPPVLVVVGVEGRDFRLGEPLSPPVAAAVDLAAKTVATVVQAVQA